MADYLLQSLDRSYLDQLMQLDHLCYGGHWGSQSYVEELDRTNTDVLGYLWGSDLVAFGILWRVLEEAHLISLAVHPDHRRQGLGCKLVAALLAQAQSQGSEWATLEVRSSNDAAQALYQRCGFQLLGRRHHYYQDPDEDALIFWQKLTVTEQMESLVEQGPSLNT